MYKKICVWIMECLRGINVEWICMYACQVCLYMYV